MAGNAKRFLEEDVDSCRQKGMTWEQTAQHIGMGSARELLRWRESINYIDPLRGELGILQSNAADNDVIILEKVKVLRDLHY